ncbi:asialoglycoprotein receptor 1-like [Aquarana catesbeiana]|uniref:asialoglycoprotein receptor 1-like n=1 Tax=Aquarana catesbeiana TaxID=8400 RepID=UPI003CC92371
MSVEYRNFQNLPEDTKPTNSPPGTWPLQGILMDRQTARPSSALICFLSSLCTALLFIIIILFTIFTRQGVNQMEQNMEVKLRNLSLGVQSRVEGLSQLGSQMMDRMKVMQNFLNGIKESKVMNNVEEIESLVIRIVSDEVAGSLSNDNQRILAALGQLADQIFKPNISSADPLCDWGWAHHGSSCYLLIKRAQPWSSAKKDCEDRKGHLVVINDEEEMGFLRTFSQFSWRLWIGLKEEDSAWKWVDGTSYDKTSKFWRNIEIDYWYSIWMRKKHGTWEECGLLAEGNQFGHSHCSNDFPYICEKKVS